MSVKEKAKQIAADIVANHALPDNVNEGYLVLAVEDMLNKKVTLGNIIIDTANIIEYENDEYPKHLKYFAEMIDDAADGKFSKLNTFQTENFKNLYIQKLVEAKAILDLLYNHDVSKYTFNPISAIEKAVEYANKINLAEKQAVENINSSKNPHLRIVN